MSSMLLRKNISCALHRLQIRGFGGHQVGMAAGLARGCVPTELTDHLSPQLDPQAVQTKNWHMDVIEMNGVSGAGGPTAPRCECSPFLPSGQPGLTPCLPQIKVEFSMKFTSRDMSLKRTPSKKQTGVFGVKISVVTK